MDSQDAKKAIEQYSLDERRKALRKFRKEAQLTQGELASRSGLNESTISRFERGSRDLSPEAFIRVQEAITAVMADRLVEKEMTARSEAENLQKLVPLSALAGRATEEDTARYARYISRNYGTHETFQRVVEFGKQLASQEKQIAALEQQVAALREQNNSLREWLSQEERAALENAKAREMEAKLKG